MKPAFLFINGVRCDPEDRDLWVWRAHRHVDRLGAESVPFPYHTWAVLRFSEQTGHVVDVARELHILYTELDPLRPVVVAAHSNGVALVLAALKLIAPSPLHLHLFAGAADPDCERNGLNAAIRAGKVASAAFYCSANDAALKWPARLSRWLTLGLGGYGDVGRIGPKNYVADGRVRTVWDDRMGHSDWFAGANFERTMRMVVASADDETPTALGGA